MTRRRKHAWSILIVLTAASLAAQQPASPAAEVLAFEREIEDAVVRGDVRFVDAASASTFTFTHGDGWTAGGAPLRVAGARLGEDRGAWRCRDHVRALRRTLQER